jgi:hypothetical protein
MLTVVRLSDTTVTENKELDARELWHANICTKTLIKPIIMQQMIASVV